MMPHRTAAAKYALTRWDTFGIEAEPLLMLISRRSVILRRCQQDVPAARLARDGTRRISFVITFTAAHLSRSIGSGGGCWPDGNGLRNEECGDRRQRPEPIGDTYLTRGEQPAGSAWLRARSGQLGSKSAPLHRLQFEFDIDYTKRLW